MNNALLIVIPFLVIAIFLILRLVFTRKKIGELASKTNFAIKSDSMMKITFEEESKLGEVASHFNSLVVKYQEILQQNKDMEGLNKDKLVLDGKVQKFEESLSQMNLLTSIGKQITGNLNVQDIFKIVFEYVKSSMDVEELELMFFEDNEEVLLRTGNDGNIERHSATDLEQNAMRWALKNNKEIVLNDAKVDYGQYMANPIKSITGDMPASIICIPLFLNTKKIGVMGVTSLHKDVYNEYHLEFLRTLASYIAVALDNSRVYQLLESGKTQIENEKKKSDQLLLNILPAEIADELKEKGEAAARKFDTVSVLFTDFKEFTQTSHLLSPEKLVAELNTCFKEFDEICIKYKIEKIKTIGDSYMAAGGIPVQSSDSIKNTVLAGIEMAEFIREKTNDTEEDHIDFEMRVGINTGPVVAGIVGVSKFQYDIWGNAVNLASRMESNGVVGKVNISQDTYNVIKDDPDFVFESRGKVEAKGSGEVDMYFVSTN